MHSAKSFTKLDASSGCRQIKVDEESSKLLTFSTPFGRLRFNRLLNEMHGAREVFQQDIEKITGVCDWGKEYPRQYHHMGINFKSVRHLH